MKRKKTETFQVILNGNTIVGLRCFQPGENNSLRQVVEYNGYRFQDPNIYRSNSDPEAILWEARRILVDLYEEKYAQEGPADMMA